MLKGQGDDVIAVSNPAVCKILKVSMATSDWYELRVHNAEMEMLDTLTYGDGSYQGTVVNANWKDTAYIAIECDGSWTIEFVG